MGITFICIHQMDNDYIYTQVFILGDKQVALIGDKHVALTGGQSGSPYLGDKQVALILGDKHVALIGVQTILASSYFLHVFETYLHRELTIIYSLMGVKQVVLF